jgi:hypothetical protein
VPLLLHHPFDLETLAPELTAAAANASAAAAVSCPVRCSSTTVKAARDVAAR